MRGCPVCGSKISTLIQSVHMMVPEENGFPADFDVVSCAGCGSVRDDIIDSSSYSVFTGKNGDYSIREDARFLNGETVDFLEKHAGRDVDRKVLDVGCSYGVLLRILAERGYSALSGMDLDVNAINFLRNSGFHMYAGSASAEYPLETGAVFDLIVMRHIVEHLYSPRDSIARAARYLSRDGLLLVEVPNLALYQSTAPFPGFFVEEIHINHFSRSSLSNLLNEWDIVAVEESRAIYPTLRMLLRNHGETKRPIAFSLNDRQYILDALNSPNEAGKGLLGRIDSLLKKDIALWGCGVFVHRLLTYTRLKDCRIQIMVDGSGDVQGKRLLGKTIMPPEALRDFKGVIVIAGKGSRRGILAAIERLGLDNEVVCLED